MSVIIELPEAEPFSGKSVSVSFAQRETIREISGKKLPLQVLSNLLWAANGFNRKDGPFGTGGRTAASASNSQEIDVYLAMQEGFYLYDALQHRLMPVLDEDLRSYAIGKRQPWNASNAPLHIIYIADVDRLIHTSGYQEPGLQDPEVQKSYYFVDTGIIAGNVYLFASSQGLASWFHNCDREGLSEKLKLRHDQRVLFGQTVGYPA
ncbi:MAG: nitroreductase family protein [Brevinematales bacterium]|jgi:SagB-type dehydrogenase family enzyme